MDEEPDPGATEPAVGTGRRRARWAAGVAAVVLAGGLIVEVTSEPAPSDVVTAGESDDTAADDTATDDTPTDGSAAGAAPGRTDQRAPVGSGEGGDQSSGDDSEASPGSDDTVDPLDLLDVAPESDGGVDYDRDEYGGWITHPDGCRTRDRVLRRDARPPGAQTDPSCRVLAGEWTDPYTNEAVFADDAGEVSDLVHVDHVVALAEAHRSGGWRWGPALKRDFANDMDNLLATAASVNISKSDHDPASWQPPATDRWCAFTDIWIETKIRWDLDADRAEFDALHNMRSARSCPTSGTSGTAAPTTTEPATGPSSTTTAASTEDADGEGCTPGYDPCIPPGDDVDCAGGGGNGPRYVEGPVSVDHAHGDPYRLDGDGDGVACA